MSHQRGKSPWHTRLRGPLDYLETKRMAFPRFYFLSNDELLEIMSQTRDPHAVQPHMSKCFDAIKRIKFGEGKHGHDILGFLDPGGEYVPLTDSVKAEGPVEAWLLSFEKGMRKTLYDCSKKAFQEYPATPEGAIDRKEWLWRYPAQIRGIPNRKVTRHSKKPFAKTYRAMVFLIAQRELREDHELLF